MPKTILKYSSLTAFCWLFFASALSGLEADVFEVDNTPEQALARAALNDGEQTHTIHATNDIDYVHFTVAAGRSYRLETTVLDRIGSRDRFAKGGYSYRLRQVVCS